MTKGKKNQKIKWKQYCNKFNKYFKNGPHKKRILKKEREISKLPVSVLWEGETGEDSPLLSKSQSVSRVRLFVTPRTVAHQAPLSMGFCRQEYWSGSPFPSPGDLPHSGIEPESPALQADSFTIWATREALVGQRLQQVFGCAESSRSRKGGRPTGLKCEAGRVPSGCWTSNPPSDGCVLSQAIRLGTRQSRSSTLEIRKPDACFASFLCRDGVVECQAWTWASDWRLRADGAAQEVACLAKGVPWLAGAPRALGPAAASLFGPWSIQLWLLRPSAGRCGVWSLSELWFYLQKTRFLLSFPWSVSLVVQLKRFLSCTGSFFKKKIF